jgi:hypothetical protein
MARSLYGFGQFSLMTGAHSGSFFCSNFGQTGNKPFQKVRIFKIYFLYITLAKMTSHEFTLKIQISISKNIFDDFFSNF